MPPEYGAPDGTPESALPQPPPGANGSTPPPAPRPTPAEKIGAVQDPWAGLEPELRQNVVAAKKWETPADAARAYAAAQKLLGRPPEELVHVPKAGLTPEMRRELKARVLGTPETPEGYDFGEIADPEGGPQMLGWWKGVAHELGLGPEEARQAAEAWQRFGQEQDALAESKAAEQRAQAATTLQQKYGSKFSAMRESGARALAALGITAPESGESSELELMLEQAMGPVAFFETFAQLGQRLGEHRLVEGKGVGEASSIQELEAERASLMRDPKGPYWVKDHPGHQAAVDRVKAIMVKIHGETPAWGPGSE